jgi:hypothetical protein
VRAGFVGFQLDVNDALGLATPSNIRRGRRLPKLPGKEQDRTRVPLGTFFVVGDCTGLYVSDGRYWEPVEKRLPGAQRWRVTFGRPTPGTRQPLWSTRLEPPSPNQLLWANWVDDHHIRIEYEWTGAPYAIAAGKTTMHVDPGRSYDFDVRLDPKANYIEVKHDNQLLFMGFPSTFTNDTPSTLGHQPDPARGSTTFNRAIHIIPTTPICDRLTHAIASR